MIEATTSNCKRCNRLCRVTAGASHPDARILRKAGVGCCANCGITSFIKTGPLAEVTGGRWTAPGFDVGSALRLPHVQQQFQDTFRAANNTDVAQEIDWELVIANWELPIPEGFDWGGELYASGKRKRGKR